jgi:hypothetical protein
MDPRAGPMIANKACMTWWEWRDEGHGVRRGEACKNILGHEHVIVGDGDFSDERNYMLIIKHTRMFITSVGPDLLSLLHTMFRIWEYFGTYFKLGVLPVVFEVWAMNTRRSVTFWTKAESGELVGAQGWIGGEGLVSARGDGGRTNS